MAGMRRSSSLAGVTVISPKTMVARARRLALSQAPMNDPAMAARLNGRTARLVAVGRVAERLFHRGHAGGRVSAQRSASRAAC
jgi:hypothetical protein